MKYYFSNDYKQAVDVEQFRNSTLREKTRIKGETLLIDIRGILEPACGSALEDMGIITPYDSIIQDLTNIPDNITEIIFIIDSCGGSVRHLKETADLIKDLGEKYSTVAYIKGICASAAYYLACSCNKIIATDSAEIGSIGTVCVIDDSEDEKIKIVVSTGTDYKIRTAENKDQYDSYLQQRVDALATEFRSWVARNRSLTDEEEVYSGKMFNALQAVDLGLVDGILSIVAFMNLTK